MTARYFTTSRNTLAYFEFDSSNISLKSCGIGQQKIEKVSAKLQKKK